MHELTITKNLITSINKECLKREIKNPRNITIKVGQLTTYKSECLLFYFEQLKKETFLSKASLCIQEISGKIQCLKCDTKSSIKDPYDMFCPRCNSPDTKITQGKEITLTSIEVD